MCGRASINPMKATASLHDVVRHLLVPVLALGLSLSGASAATTQGVDARTAFARLKSLSGDWTGSKMMGHRMNVDYRVIAGGSAVLETCFPGTPMEMVTVYYVKGNDLILSHYCMLGNQPRMKLNTKKSTPDTLVFDFAGGDNIGSTKSHMHSATLKFVGRNRLESTGTLKERGKPESTCSTTLTRKG